MANIKAFSRSQQVFIYSILVVVLSLLSAFSIFGESRDIKQYLELFNILGKGERLEDLYTGYIRLQFGFRYLNRIVYSISESFELFVFAITFFALIPKFFLINYHSKSKHISILIYILFIYPLHELEQIRIALSLGLLYYSIHLYSLQKYIKSILFVLLASSIHISSIVLFLGTISLDLINYLINLKIWKIRKKNLLILLAFSLVIILALSFGILRLNIFYYLTNYGTPGSFFSVRTFLLAVITLIGGYFKKYFPNNIKTWYNLSVLGLISYYALIYSMDLSHRISQATYFAYILWIEYLPPKTRLFCRSILIIIAIVTILLHFSLYIS